MTATIPSSQTLRFQWLRAAARTLNEHHTRTCAGFYGSKIGGRYFQARVKDGVLQVSDWTCWTTVTDDSIQFHDHNGREITITH